MGVPSPLTATSVLRDRDGGLWVGTTAHGLVHSYGGKTSLFTHNDGLSSDQVYALFEDREGTIWVATSDGLDQFRELPVTSLSRERRAVERDGYIRPGGARRQRMDWHGGWARSMGPRAHNDLSDANQSRPARRRYPIAVRG